MSGEKRSAYQKNNEEEKETVKKEKKAVGKMAAVIIIALHGVTMKEKKISAPKRHLSGGFSFLNVGYIGVILGMSAATLSGVAAWNLSGVGWYEK